MCIILNYSQSGDVTEFKGLNGCREAGDSRELKGIINITYMWVVLSLNTWRMEVFTFLIKRSYLMRVFMTSWWWLSTTSIVVTRVIGTGCNHMRLAFNDSYRLCGPLKPYCIFRGGLVNSQLSYTYLMSWVGLELYNILFINYISDVIVTPDTSVKYNTHLNSNSHCDQWPSNQRKPENQCSTLSLRARTHTNQYKQQ